MTLPPECRQRLEALEGATARLAGLNRDCTEQVERALEERARAVDAMVGWIAAEQTVAHPLSQELANRLASDLERGADILIRLSLDRDAARLALAEVDRGLQMLRELKRSAPAKPSMIDCQG
ncbi:MAG: hypothetical protein LAP39_03910 [Acidobacteriia bacterium]|nr:hypothetical protein [Terriglobia bacterium]